MCYIKNIVGEEVWDILRGGAPGDAGGDQEDVLPRVTPSSFNRWFLMFCLSVMRIRLNYYMDPDPGSGNPPYKFGSGSKEKTSQNSIFQILWKKRTYRYRTAALYKIGKGPKRTAEVTEELQRSIRMAMVTGGQLRSHEVI